MKTYIDSGNVITVTATAAVTSGVAVLVGAAMFGVPVTSAAIGEKFELKRDGQYTLKCAATTVAAQGDKAYFNAGAGEITAVNTDVPVGVFGKAVINGDVLADVALSQS